MRGKIGAKAVGVFAYEKQLENEGVTVPCEVKVFPLLVKRQAKTWLESEQRIAQWFEPEKAVSLIGEPGLKALISEFVKKRAVST